MSVAAERSTTSSIDGSTIPERGARGQQSASSGPLRAPHEAKRGSMTAVEGKSDGVALLVVEWQGADAVGQRRLANLIMRLLQPTVRRVALRFGASARGSLAQEDLEQVASIEAFKFFSKYEHGRRGAGNSGSFEQLVYRRALKACVVYAEMHGADVRPSRHMQQAAKGHATGSYKGRKVEASCSLENTDDTQPEAHTETPEKQLADVQTLEQLRIAISFLSDERREIVREAFGLGTLDSAASLRDMARRRRVPRSRLATELDEALTELRGELECP